MTRMKQDARQNRSNETVRARIRDLYEKGEKDPGIIQDLIRWVLAKSEQ